MGGRIPGDPLPGLPQQGTEEKAVRADSALQPRRVFRLAEALRLAPRGLGHGLTRSRHLASLLRPSRAAPVHTPERAALARVPRPGEGCLSAGRAAGAKSALIFLSALIVFLLSAHAQEATCAAGAQAYTLLT